MRRSYRRWSRSITPLERRRERRSCSEDAIWKTCCGMKTRTPQSPSSNVRMGDLLWKTQQHASRMRTRTPQLQEQSKLKGDSLLKQQQHAIVVKTHATAAASKEKAKRTEVMSRSQENKNEKTNERDEAIRRLIEERRNIVKGDKHQLKDLSKKIKKCIRDSKRTKRQEQILWILEEFRGIKSRSCIKSGRKRTLIPKVRNDTGKTITSRKGIATVFGEFYSKIYAEHQLGEEVQDPQNLETRINTEKKSCNEEVRNEIPDFTHKMKYKPPLITSKK